MKWGYMMYLHNDKELFKDVINATAVDLNRPIVIFEKNYYATMILKQLTKTEPK